MSQHTPGPWVARKVGVNTKYCGFSFDVGVTKGRDSGPESVSMVYDEANARLIAKAPEMLVLLDDLANREHCKKCNSLVTRDICTHDRARALLREIEEP